MNRPRIKAYILRPQGFEGSLGFPAEMIGCILMKGQVLGVQGFCEEVPLIYKTPIKQHLLRGRSPGARGSDKWAVWLFSFIYNGTAVNMIKNVSPWQNQGCTIWPWNRTATCTACLHRTTVPEAFRGTCTDRFASAHPPGRMPGLSWWTQGTIHVSDVGVQALLSD